MADQRSKKAIEQHVADLELAAADAGDVNGGAGQGKVSMNDLLAGHAGSGAGKVSMNDLRATAAGIDKLLEL